MSGNDLLPPLIYTDEEQWTEITGDVIAYWMQNNQTFFQDQKKKVKELALGPFLFRITEHLSEAWKAMLVSSGLLTKERLESLGPLSEDEHATLCLAQQLLERCVQLMTNKGDLRTILNFIHDIEERRSMKSDCAVDLSYAQREIFAMHVFTSMWASFRRLYEKKKKSHAAVCVIYFFKIIQNQVYLYGQNGGDYINFIKNNVKTRRMDKLNAIEGQEILAQTFCNAANKAFKEKNYNKALKDYTQAIHLNPFDPTFMTNRAQAHLNLKKFGEAFWDSKRAIILDPSNSKNYYRCACACIEFGWLDDAKEMNARSLENSQRDEDRRAILKQAHSIEEKRDNMKAVKEPKISEEKETLTTCTDKINFRKLLISACNHFQRSQYQQSIQVYDQAMDYISRLGIERLGIVEKDVLVMTYVLSMAMVYTATNHNLLAAVDKLSSILTADKEFTVAFYGIVKACVHLHRYKEAREYALDGLQALQSQANVSKDKVLLWPASDCVIEESNHSELKKLLKALLKECQYPPIPDAFCKIHVDFENPRQEIYLSSHDYKGFVRVTCRQHCSLDYHISCWKAFKSSLSEKHQDKTMIDTDCPTPDCYGLINTISIFRTDTDTPIQFYSILKDSKPPRPIVRQKLTNPEKLQKKQEQKRLKKQKKAEHTAKERQEKREIEEEKKRTENTTQLVSIGDAQKAEMQTVYKGEATVLLKDQSEVLHVAKQKSSKIKKKKEKSKQVIPLDVQFRGDDEKILVSAASLDDEEYLMTSLSGSGLLPTPGTAIWPIGNGLLPVPNSVPLPDETAFNLYEFFYGFLKTNGPQDVDSSLLNDWLSDFPEEAKQKISSYGGIKNFIFANKRFTVINSRVLCNMEDQARAVVVAANLSKSSNGKLSSVTNHDPMPGVNQSSGVAETSSVSASVGDAKKPIFSWEERGRKLKESSSTSQSQSERDTDSYSTYSAMNALDPISIPTQVDTGRGRPGEPTTELQDSGALTLSGGIDDFITVGKKKGATGVRNEGSDTSSSGSSASSMPPLSLLKSVGRRGLPRNPPVPGQGALSASQDRIAAAIAAQDRPHAKISQDSAPGSARSLRDDMSDVTTQSSDSASIMDMIEELLPLEPSVEDRRGDASNSSFSLMGQGVSTGSDSGTTAPKYPASQFAALSAMTSNSDVGSVPVTRRDSDSSVRSDEYQRSCSPSMSQGSTGSGGQAQPAPLKPLKVIAGIRRGKGKAMTREGHGSRSGLSATSRISNLATNTQGGVPGDLISIFDMYGSETSTDAVAKLTDNHSSQSSSTNGDVDTVFTTKEDPFKSHERTADEVGSNVINAFGHTGQLGSSKPEGGGGEEDEGFKPQNSIWELAPTKEDKNERILERLPFGMFPETAEGLFETRSSSPRTMTGGISGDVPCSSKIKDPWSSSAAYDHEEKSRRVDRDIANIFQSQKAAVSAGSTTAVYDFVASYMPSFNDDTIFTTNGGGGGSLPTSESESGSYHTAPTDVTWPSSFDSLANLETKLDSMSNSVLSHEPSIWGRTSATTSALFPLGPDLSHQPSVSPDNNIRRPARESAYQLPASLRTSPIEEAESSLAKPSSSILNPCSKEFVPCQPVGVDAQSYVSTVPPPSSLDALESNEHDLTNASVCLTSEEETQTDSATLRSTSVNTTLTAGQISQLVSEFEMTTNKCNDLKSALDLEREEKDKLMMMLRAMTSELEGRDSALTELRHASVLLEKHCQSTEGQLAEMKRQMTREQKRAIESEKKFLTMMSQLIVQKLNSRKEEGQRHFRQLMLLVQSLKTQAVFTPPAIVSKAKEWDVFIKECEIQMQTLTELYSRYNERLDQGVPLDELPDITTRVTIPEIPQPPSLDDVGQPPPPLPADSFSQKSSVVPPQPPPALAGGSEMPPQSSMLASLSSHSSSKHVSSQQNRSNTAATGFKRPAPLTLPQRQRFPKTNSMASQVAPDVQRPSSPTAYEKIMTELQASFPDFSRADISKMIDGLRQARGGRLTQMNVRELSQELSVMASEQNDQDHSQIAPSRESSLGDVISITRSNSEEDVCPICHEELSCMQTDTLHCGHKFHVQCIKQWFDRQRSCPVCRVHSLLPDEFPNLMESFYIP